MEDAATAEISRTQLWQWVHHQAKMIDGRSVTSELVSQLMNEELAKLREELGTERFDSGKFDLAADLFTRMAKAPEFPEFLTSVAYEYLP
jgi:malate synthase